MSFSKKRKAAVLVGAGALMSLSLAAVGTPSASAAGTEAGAFNPVTPARLLDTRTATAVPGGGSIEVQVTGRGNVPANAGAVVLNVTVTKGQGPGHVTVFPSGTTAPTASSLNFVANQTIANAVTVKLGENGKVTLKNGSAQPVQLIADVTGWYVGGTADAPGMFRPVAPQRLLDTREGLGAARAQVAAKGSVTFDVGGTEGIPANATAAVLNVTVTKGLAPGHITAHPAGTAAPTASNLNFVARQTIANAVTVKLGTNGDVTLTNGSTAPVDLVVDIAGWFVAGQASLDGAFVPVAPERLLDTRTDVWYGTFTETEEGDRGPVPADHDVFVWVEGQLGLADGTASAAVVNVTATRGSRAGHITAYDGESDIPNASSLNFTANQTIPNQVTVGLAEYGDLGLYNGSTAPVHLIADVAGYYLN